MSHIRAIKPRRNDLREHRRHEVNLDLALELKNLCQAGTAAYRSRRRFAVRKYLQEVLRNYRRWEDAGNVDRMTQEAAAFGEMAVRQGTHPLKVLIDLTCPEPDPKVRSRLGRALEAAERYGVQTNELSRYFTKSGGIAGAARKVAITSERSTWDEDEAIEYENEFDEFDDIL